VHAVRLDPSGVWVANVHAQAHSHERAQTDLAAAARAVLRWAGDAPIVLGGDLNDPRPHVEGFNVAGGHGVDHLLVRGLIVDGAPRVLEHAPLSDHAPVLVSLRRHPG
jgi:endonuclease/exonuclease/phosphatase (EEP) superfamily protein YafD